MFQITADYAAKRGINILSAGRHISVHDDISASCKYYIGCKLEQCSTVHCTRISAHIADIMKKTRS